MVEACREVTELVNDAPAADGTKRQNQVLGILFIGQGGGVGDFLSHYSAAVKPARFYSIFFEIMVSIGGQ